MMKLIMLAWASLFLISLNPAASASEIYPVDLPEEFVSEVETIFNVNQDGTAFNMGLVSGENPNLHLFQEAEIHVTFIHEAAGYKNQFGYFTYDDANDDGVIGEDEILDEAILFPNVSEEGEVLQTGDTVNIGPFPAGTNVGFFIVANGYVDPQGTYYSLPELNPDGAQHFPMVATSDGTNVAIGIEDLPWASSDKDCNDVIFTFTTTPEDAIVEVIEENEIPVNETPEEEIPEEEPAEEVEEPAEEPAEQPAENTEDEEATEQPEVTPEDPSVDNFEPVDVPGHDDFIVKDGDLDETTPLDPATGPAITPWYLEGTGMGCTIGGSGGEASVSWILACALATLPALRRRRR